ncbi:MULTISPECIES: YbaB/EbfC family nucleoid-associated protein [unclassified Nocardia]|uniref:YbaB/EbfC family nucleoid-associated protein n=1 Tax=unclassified Nocardia TaxID=2637762 RepID=UPI001CE44815|nr:MULTISPECIES: YbaB/EbfC family nucleoid-associated protein [unclassified Nocardia]
MAEEVTEEMVANLLENVAENIVAVRRFHDQRTQLIAEGTAARNRVTVVVNADGHIIDTRFGPDYTDLSRSELGKAVTEAAHRAIEEIRRKTMELMEPIQQRHDRLPKIGELFPGMPDLSEVLSRPAASLAPPSERPPLGVEAQPPAARPAAERPSADGTSDIFDRGW